MIKWNICGFFSSSLKEKIWREKYPLLFFGIVVSVKLYYLVDFILILLMGEAVASGSVRNLLGLYLFHSYSVVSLLFDCIVFLTFFIRHEASHTPVGFRENIFPLLVVFLPVIGFFLLNIPQIRNIAPPYPDKVHTFLSQFSIHYLFYVNLTGLFLGFCGAAFSIWTIIFLKRSFGLRVAVRKFIDKGPYKLIRHPLYLGEIIHLSGIAILSGTPVGIWLFTISVLMQIVRAALEERKFIQCVPEYSAYRNRTGFLMPKLNLFRHRIRH
jgi:protein-S-isoprenylcysteine O-methyltransferase Ste14